MWGKDRASALPVIFVLDAQWRHHRRSAGPALWREHSTLPLDPPPVCGPCCLGEECLAGDVERFVDARGRRDPTRPAPSGTLLTPALISPESYTDRGWLRAELDVDLARGAVIEASFASTKNDAIAAQLTTIAEDSSASVEHRQQQIWSLLDHPAERTFTVTGPSTRGVPVAFPLFDARDRWLWLRLRVVSPPDTTRPKVRELRVLYPDASIDRYLPATFKGSENDPNGVLRRLVGVLEVHDPADRRAHRQHRRATAGRHRAGRVAGLHRPLVRSSLGRRAERRGQARDSVATPATSSSIAARVVGSSYCSTSLLGAAGSARVSDVTVDHPVVADRRRWTIAARRFRLFSPARRRASPRLE